MNQPATRRPWRLALGAALALAGALGAVHGRDLLRLQGPSNALAALKGQASTQAERGAALFAYGDFGALSSDTLQVSASPWKLLVAALALQEVGGERLHEFDQAATFRRWGFLTPEGIANWPEGLARPAVAAPLGQNVGLAGHPLLPGGVTVGNIGCAACHGGVVYDAEGYPDPSRAWIGAPNTSINLQGFTVATFEAFRDQAGDGEAMMAAVRELFPDTGAVEMLLLRRAVLPAVRARVAERDASLGGLLPFQAGLPGATNGLDSLRARLGLIPEGERVALSAFNSVPELGDRLLRTRLLNTGSYVLPGEEAARATGPEDLGADHLRAFAGVVATFPVPSMGLEADEAAALRPDMEDVVAWLAEYEPQPFPGEVDESLLGRGREVYAAACASCHGDTGEDPRDPRLVSFPNWTGDVGTDGVRRDLLTPALAEAVNGSALGDLLTLRMVDGYAAPPLTGLWSSGPYLHNGAVPTIWHLMHPEARLERFAVGGHAVDLDRLGVLIDGGPAPWSEPVVIDTSAPGLSAVGHEAPFDAMSEADKAALLEYLKLL